MEHVSDEKIISATGAWMLCCAVGAYTHTLGFSGDFDMWFRCCRDTWVKRVKTVLGVDESRIKSVILDYAKRNASRSYMEVFESESTLHPDIAMSANEPMAEVAGERREREISARIFAAQWRKDNPNVPGESLADRMEKFALAWGEVERDAGRAAALEEAERIVELEAQQWSEVPRYVCRKLSEAIRGLK